MFSIKWNVLFVGLLLQAAAFAQSAIRPLQVGDTVPDLFIPKLINYTAATAHISDFRGKLVVLDFWSIYCVPCVEGLFKMDKLQRTFGDAIRILPVTDYGTARQNQLFLENLKNRKATKGLPSEVEDIQQAGGRVDLPSVVEDSLLKKYFPSSGYPHEVWIDKNGVVIGITDQDPVTYDNIAAILKGKKLHFTSHKLADGFQYRTPLFVHGNGGAGNVFLSRSMFTACNDSINSIGFQRDTTPAFTRLFHANTSLQRLYALAYAWAYPSFQQAILYDRRDKRILVDGGKPLPYHNFPLAATPPDVYEEFKQHNLFCYELVLPPRFTLTQAYPVMIQDLDRFFGINSKLETREVHCLALVRTSAIDKIHTKGIDTLYKVSKNEQEIHFHGYELGSLVYWMNFSCAMPFAIDQTGYTLKADIDITLPNTGDLEALRRRLREYDLDLVDKQCALPMLVLSVR